MWIFLQGEFSPQNVFTAFPQEKYDPYQGTRRKVMEAFWLLFYVLCVIKCFWLDCLF